MSESPTVGGPGCWLRSSQSSLPSAKAVSTRRVGRAMSWTAPPARQGAAPRPPPRRCHGSHDCGSSGRRSSASLCHLLGDPADRWQGLSPKPRDRWHCHRRLGKAVLLRPPRCVIYIDLEAEYDVLNLLSGQIMYTGSTPASWRELRRSLKPATLPLSSPHSRRLEL